MAVCRKPQRHWRACFSACELNKSPLRDDLRRNIEAPGRPSMKQKIRVAFLGKGATRGGSQRELSYMVRYLDKERFEPMVLLREGGDLLAEFESSAPTHVYPEPDAAPQTRPPNRILQLLGRKADRAPGNPLSGRADAQRDWALKLVTAFRPDVIVRQYHFPIPEFESIETLKIPSVQSVLLYGAGFAQMNDDDVRRFIKRSAIFVCPGKKVRDYLHGCWGVPLDRIATNCIGLDLTIRDEQMKHPGRLRRADIGLDEDSVVVATSGSFHYLKGVDIWVETAALLRARYPGRKAEIHVDRRLRGTAYGQPIRVRRDESRPRAWFDGRGDFCRRPAICLSLPGRLRYLRAALAGRCVPHATLEAMAMGKPVVSFPEGVAREPYARDALVRVESFRRRRWRTALRS